MLSLYQLNFQMGCSANELKYPECLPALIAVLITITNMHRLGRCKCGKIIPGNLYISNILIATVTIMETLIPL